VGVSQNCKAGRINLPLSFFPHFCMLGAPGFHVKIEGHSLCFYVFNIALLNKGDQTDCCWEFFPILLNSQLNLLGREGTWWSWEEYLAQWGWLWPIGKVWPPRSLSLQPRPARALRAFHVVHGPWGNKDWLISTCSQKLEWGPVHRGNYLCLILG